MGHYIPLTWLTLGLDYLVWGMDPRGYHLTSLLFHAATALAFYAVARRLLARALPSDAPAAERHAGRRGGRPVLRRAPAARRVGRLGHRAPRRGVRALLRADAPRLPQDGRGSGRRGAAGTWARSRSSPARFSRSPSPSRCRSSCWCLDVYPLRRLGAGARLGRAERLAREDPVRRPGDARRDARHAATPSSAQLRSRLWLLRQALIAVYGLAFYLEKTVLPVGLSPLYAYHDPRQLGAPCASVLAVRSWWRRPGGAGRPWPAAGVDVRRAPPADARLLRDRPPGRGGPLLLSRVPWLGARGRRPRSHGPGPARAWCGPSPRSGDGSGRADGAAGSGLARLGDRSGATPSRSSPPIASRGSISAEPMSAAGACPEAIDQYREVLKLSRDKAPWYEVLGWLYASSGQVAEGLPLLARGAPSRARDGPAPASTRARPCALLDVPPPPELAGCPPAGLGPTAAGAEGVPPCARAPARAGRAGSRS